jgi:hypothetical protein
MSLCFIGCEVSNRVTGSQISRVDLPHESNVGLSFCLSLFFVSALVQIKIYINSTHTNVSARTRLS